MAIKKQEFYEGAALHLLARTGRITSIRYAAPFFLVNEDLFILLKYSTKGRSPWGFTFTRDEQELLHRRAPTARIVIGLICGADGVVAVPYDCYRAVAGQKSLAVHISCYRNHGQHYEVNGPDGKLRRKVAPLDWQRVLEDEVENETS